MSHWNLKEPGLLVPRQLKFNKYGEPQHSRNLVLFFVCFFFLSFAVDSDRAGLGKRGVVSSFYVMREVELGYTIDTGRL